MQKAPSGDLRFVQVRFGSDTDPIIQDNPRGWRRWEGTLEVQGATLINASSASLQNQLREHLRVDASHSNRVVFATLTRGNFSYIDLELKDAGPRTTLKLSLIPDTESPSTPLRFRQPAVIPAQEITFTFREMQSGKLSKLINQDDFSANIMLQHVSSSRPWDEKFEFIDHSPRQGDYYYLRVDQTDGHQAWSSPIWIE